MVAPATADFLARAATGRADDLLTACLLATTAPVLLVPAMNDRMWAHGQTARNVSHLRDLGYRVLDPETGDLAVGEGHGPGRMPEPDTILAHLGRVLEGPGDLEGRRVVVSAGPTRESLDPVRFLSNRSSGKMGVALGAAAWRRGADVVLVAGPLAVSPPVGAELRRVETTEQMRDVVANELTRADVIVMAAAPGDFRAHHVEDVKLKRGEAPVSVRLAPTPDILVETRTARKPGMVAVGFALETGDGVANARAKLKSKDLDLIVLNDAREDGAGFEVDTNRVTFVFRDGREQALPILTKDEVADAILDQVAELLRGR